MSVPIVTALYHWRAGPGRAVLVVRTTSATR